MSAVPDLGLESRTVVDGTGLRERAVVRPGARADRVVRRAP